MSSNCCHLACWLLPWVLYLVLVSAGCSDFSKDCGWSSHRDMLERDLVWWDSQNFFVTIVISETFLHSILCIGEWQHCVFAVFKYALSIRQTILPVTVALLNCFLCGLAHVLWHIDVTWASFYGCNFAANICSACKFIPNRCIDSISINLRNATIFR